MRVRVGANRRIDAFSNDDTAWPISSLNVNACTFLAVRLRQRLPHGVRARPHLFTCKSLVRVLSSFVRVLHQL
jgi:hypothetical protein